MDIKYGKNSATLEDVRKQIDREKRKRWKEKHPSTAKKNEEELIKILSENI